MSYIKKLFLIPLICIFCLEVEAQQGPGPFAGCTYTTGGFNASIYEQRIGMSLSTLHNWFFKAAAPLAAAINTYDLNHRSSQEQSMLCMLYEVFSDRVHNVVRSAWQQYTIQFIISTLSSALVAATEAVLRRYREHRGEKATRAVRNLNNQYTQIVRDCREGVYDYQQNQCRELAQVPICKVTTPIQCNPNNEEASDKFFGLNPMGLSSFT